MAVRGFLPPRRGPFHPPDLLSELRAGDPIAKVTLCDGRRAWLVTRYEDARSVLCDPRFSADATNPGLPSLSPGRVFPTERRTMSRTDGPRHAALRAVLAPEFTAGRVAALRPVIESIAASAIDGMLAAPARPVDFHASFAVPVPERLVCALLGVPDADRPRLRGWARILTSRTTTPGELAAADDALYAYCADLVARRLAAPATDPAPAADPAPAHQTAATEGTGDGAGVDMLGRLVDRGVRADRVTERELCLMVKLLVVAGHEPTANMISLATLTLLLTPGWYGTMGAAPGAVPGAVEELLRYHTLMHDGLPRVATEDVRIGGVTISAGDGVIVSVASGNRDAAVFDRPNELDMFRPNAESHLAFGAGAHRCVAAELARAELRIALRTLAERIPTLQLAVPFADISFMEDMHIYGVRELPVTW